MDPFPTLLLTRPAEANARFLAALRAAGVTLPALCSPLIEIEPLPPANCPEGDLVFTSQQAVAPFAAAFPRMQGRRAWCVGARTAEVARQAGYAVRVGAGQAKALEQQILAEGGAGPFVHVCGDHLAHDLVGGLLAAGRQAFALQVYRQVPQRPTRQALALLSGETPVLVPVFSPRTAQIFTKYLPENHAPLYLGAISTTVARQLAAVANAHIEVSRETSSAAMVELLKRLACRSVAT
ncbi:uroporphyrinogen-III synthase [Thioclava sp. GXIMD4215]|uniref:uroporphyrinogen-III synthase n=1 Tax=Thioclava sp. GXIMD4215 TaxID=3131928 RepID=UPI00324FB2B6